MKVRKEIILAVIRAGKIVTKQYVYFAIGLTMVGVDTNKPLLYLIQRAAIVDNLVRDDPSEVQTVGVFGTDGERI